MHKIIVIFLLFLLSACSTISISGVSKASLDDKLNGIIVNLDKNYNFRKNNTLPYFSYYLPFDMQESDSFENSTIITFLNSKIIMNLNIASIVNKKYYVENLLKEEGFFDSSKKCYENNGTFIKDDGNKASFTLKVYQYSDKYLIHLVTDELNFYCDSNDNDIEDVIRHIFLIAKSVEVDTNTLISNYSAKEVIDYQKKQVDLFDYIIPSSGYLSDLVHSSNGTIINEEFEEKIEEEVNENEDKDEIEENAEEIEEDDIS